nr:T9SS type A sorting domain-containing protein [bacterium]
KIIAADDKLLKSSGFIKSLGSARPIYSLTAKNSNDQILPNFAAPVRIYFNWLDSDNNGIIDNSDIREKYISIYCLDEINNQWIKVNTAIDELNNSASADVNHFSVYTLFGANFTEGGILFYPNPTLNKKINLSITTAPQSGNTMRLTIINPFGRLVYENSFPLVSGTVNQFFDIDLSALPVGGYYAKIEYGGFSKILGIGIGK